MLDYALGMWYDDTMAHMITERPLTNQRTFRCRCEQCLQRIGKLERKHGKLWQADYGEPTKSFHKRVRVYHATQTQAT